MTHFFIQVVDNTKKHTKQFSKLYFLLILVGLIEFFAARALVITPLSGIAKLLLLIAILTFIRPFEIDFKIALINEFDKKKCVSLRLSLVKAWKRFRSIFIWFLCVNIFQQIISLAAFIGTGNPNGMLPWNEKIIFWINLNFPELEKYSSLVGIAFQAISLSIESCFFTVPYAIIVENKSLFGSIKISLNIISRQGLLVFCFLLISFLLARSFPFITPENKALLNWVDITYKTLIPFFIYPILEIIRFYIYKIARGGLMTAIKS